MTSLSSSTPSPLQSLSLLDSSVVHDDESINSQAQHNNPRQGLSPREILDDHEVKPYHIKRTPTDQSTGSRLSKLSSRLSRQTSNLSQLSRIVTGIKDDQQITNNLKYTRSTEIDYILANELDRATSRITARRQSISVDTPAATDVGAQEGIRRASKASSDLESLKLRARARRTRKPSYVTDENEPRLGIPESPELPEELEAKDELEAPEEEAGKEEEEEEEAEAGKEEEEEEGKYKADGGMAWVMAFCAMMNMFATWGGSASFGVFLNYYLTSDTFPEATQYDFALIGGIIVFLANVLSPISALLYKIFGFKIICFMGVILQTAGWILASFAKKIWHLYLTQGVLVGISFLLIFMPSTLVIPTWFIKQKAASMGLTMAGTGLGGLVFSLSVNKVIQDTGDQKWALRMVGFVCLFLVMISAMVMKPRNYKQPPLKVTLTKEFIRENAKMIFQFKVFRSFGLCVIAIWFTLILIGYTLMLFSLSSYATSIGLSHSQASTLTAIMNAAQTVGRPCMGFIADYFGRANFSGVCSVILTVLIYAYWINAKTYGALIGFAILIGLLIGVGASLAQPLAADVIAPNMELMPAAWSGINIFLSFFCLVTEVIALALIVKGAKNPYLHTQIFAGTCFAVCCFVILVLREYLVRKVLHERLDMMEKRLTKIVGTTKSGYLKSEDLPKMGNSEEDDTDCDSDSDEEFILHERVERYNNLLRNSTTGYLMRMFYPLRV